MPDTHIRAAWVEKAAAGIVNLLYADPSPTHAPLPIGIAAIIERCAKESTDERLQKALDIILQYGGIDGEHHKTWVIDQVVRILTGDKYEEWVREACDGEDGPHTYSWEVGIAP